VLYHHAFLDHAFSFAVRRNPLVTAAAAAPEGTVAAAPEGAAAAYPGDSSSKREEKYLSNKQYEH